jgi:predicted RNase H-like HicB family nuclease
MHYPIKIIYSPDDNGFIATIPDLKWCSAFGDTEEEAIKEIKIVQKEWLKIAKKEGIPIPEPKTDDNYTGKITAKTPKTLHRQLSELANEEGVSLNQMIVLLLSEAVKSYVAHIKPIKPRKAA